MVIAAPSGQVPLTTNFGVPWGAGQFQGPGGGQEAAQWYAGNFFNQLFGRDPTQEELAQFTPYFIGTDPNIANVAGGQQAISSYANQLQQAQQAPQQEAQALQTQIPLISDLVKNQTSAIGADLTNPNSPTYQQFSGMMNNMGITPSSGAWQAGMGGILGQNAAQAENAALGGVALPIATGYSQGAMAPFTQTMQQPQDLFTNNLQMQDMIQQMIAASGIAGQSGPSGFESAMGLASGGAQGLGSLGQGYGAVAKGKSAVCMELFHRGLISREKLHAVLSKLLKASFIKTRALVQYEKNNRQLVNTANRKNFNWEKATGWLVDSVLESPTVSSAVNRYAFACKRICMEVGRMDLWDERVYQGGLLDSLPFWPTLFSKRAWWEILYFVLTKRLGIPKLMRWSAA